ncbi:MAG: hypothetical protein DRJ69_03355 [Thermoprotei archaeon]|nr:MAG: hypothetical protein DRJ69_03355 [Thermoprotei archaeon]
MRRLALQRGPEAHQGLDREGKGILEEARKEACRVRATSHYYNRYSRSYGLRYDVAIGMASSNLTNDVKCYEEGGKANLKDILLCEMRVKSAVKWRHGLR